MYFPQKIHLGGSMLANKTFCGPKFTKLFSSNAEGIAVDHISFMILDIWSISGDISDQSRKLSKIALNFGRFLLSQVIGGRPSKSYTHVMTSAWRHVVWKMFCGDTPTSPEVIVAKTLNFKANLARVYISGLGAEI